MRSIGPILLTLLLCLADGASAQGASVAAAIGDWQQIDYEGIYRWDDDRCSVMKLTERRMGIQRGPDGIGHGIYLNATHQLWVLNRNRACVIPGQSRHEPFLRGRYWALRVMPAANG